MAGIKFGKPSFQIGKPEGGIQFPQSTGVPLAKWKAALAAVLANTGDADLLCLGDSLTAGQISLTGSLALTTSYPYQLMQLFAADLGGDKAVIAGYCGTANVSTISALLAVDSRLSFDVPTDWTVSQNATMSGGILSTSVNNSKMHFAPGYSFDSIQIIGAGASVLTAPIYLDGGSTVVGTITGGSSSAQLNQTFTVPRGVHTIDIQKTSGSFINIGQILLRDSLTKRVRIINGGLPGVTAKNYVGQLQNWKMINVLTAIKPALTLVDLGKNEQGGFATPSNQTDYLTAMQTIITAAKASGAALLMYPEPSADPLTSNEVINRTLVDQLIRSNGLGAVIDMVAILGGSRTAEIANGWANAGDVHLTAAGYAQKAAGIYPRIKAA